MTATSSGLLRYVEVQCLLPKLLSALMKLASCQYVTQLLPHIVRLMCILRTLLVDAARCKGYTSRHGLGSVSRESYNKHDPSRGKSPTHKAQSDILQQMSLYSGYDTLGQLMVKLTGLTLMTLACLTTRRALTTSTTLITSLALTALMRK